jgi:alpha-beta hydrolase superfamily lysophospholipase
MSRLSRGLQQFIEYVICWPRRHHASLPHTTYPKSEEIWVSGIRMWYFAASQECDRVIISCHGNKRHLGNLLPLIQTFAKLNWNLILFDYHGFGQSETSSDMYSAQGMTQDILQVIEWAHEKFPTKRLFLHGHSLGGALMIRALTQSRLPIVLTMSSTIIYVDSCRPGSLI